MKIKQTKTLNSSTRFVHAATIEFQNNKPIFAYFGGTREGAKDTCIYIENLYSNGETIVMPKNYDIPRWNPILYKYKDKLFLFEKAGFFCDRWQTFYYDLNLLNENMSKEDIIKNRCFLPSGLNGPVKTRPIEYNGKIYCGSSVETIYDWASYIEVYDIKNNKLNFKYRSKPLFLNHKMLENKKSQGIIQPTLWIENNQLHGFMRSSSNYDNIYYSILKDNKWTTPQETNLKNPNSGVDVVFYNNNLYLAYNPNNKFRNPLVIDKIKNNKGTWEILDRLILESEDALTANTYSYPYMIEHNGKLHVVYTYNNEKIKYIEVAI